MPRFSGRTAIVTGAAQGVGRACALRLAAQGAKLVLVDRRADLCDGVVEVVEREGGAALAVGADMETQDGAQEMVRRAIERFGRVDISIHNVGGAIRAKPFWEFTGEELQAEISRSLWPTLWSCREVIPAMLAQRSGAIVNIGSAATRWMWRGPYSAAKGGIHALTECLGRELAETGVRINCVAPGTLDIGDRLTARNPDPITEQDAHWRQAALDQSLADTPMARCGAVDEVATAVAFLASDEASYITGQTLFVAGGATG